MLGATTGFTVSVAVVLVTLPALLLTAQRNWSPFMARVAAVTYRE